MAKSNENTAQNVDNTQEVVKEVIKVTVVDHIKRIAKDSMEPGEEYPKQALIEAVLGEGISTQSSCNENISYLTVNNKLRTKYGANRKARSKANDNDVFISLSNGKISLYDAKVHGTFAIEERETAPHGVETVVPEKFTKLLEKRAADRQAAVEKEKAEKEEAKAKAKAEKEEAAAKAKAEKEATKAAAKAEKEALKAKAEAEAEANKK